MLKTQIVCIGASTLYGIGGTKGSWANLLKNDLHSKMFAEGSTTTDRFEIYNIGIPGADINKISSLAKPFIRNIKKPDWQLLTIFHGGANNAKAVDSPTNFVCSEEQYREYLSIFLDELIDLTNNLICIGICPMNQDKVMPIVSENSDNVVYFPNDRLELFENIFKEQAGSKDISFIPLFKKAKENNWELDYLYKDGIHPNDKGHQWIYDNLVPELSKVINI